ncbi:MAG: hypothetical protein KJ072_04030 [Verrucomicrobia bacterium]|nr:hypothetical protein [Verrucomicrobiota bacterium]
MPLLVKNLSGTVQLKRADASALTVTPLDFNGYRLSVTPAAATHIALRADAPYCIIEK